MIAEGAASASDEGRPAALADVPEERLVPIDVREDIRQDREPFRRIMAAVNGLHDDQILVLRAPFEPLPLYAVLSKRGFAHWAERRSSEDWSVWFYRSSLRADPDVAAPTGPNLAPPAGVGAWTILDVRGLEPPEPMVHVLEALERLGPGERLEVRHERKPLFLYPQLDERGFAHETDEPEPGMVRILIWRRGAGK